MRIQLPKLVIEMNNAGMVALRAGQDQDEALNLAKKVFELVDIFRFTLIFVFVMVGWAVVYLALYIVGAFDWPYVYDAMVIVAGVMFLLGLLRFRDVIGGLSTLKDWKERYVSYAFLNVFEFSPRTGTDLREETVARLKKVYPAVDKALKKHPDALSYGDVIEGKKGKTYPFDVIIRVENEWLVVDVKRGGTEVGEPDVKRFMEVLAGVMKDTDMDILQGIIVSDGGFTDEAIDYASSKDNWIPDTAMGRFSPTLLKATESGYTIEWLQAMQRS
jgi:hypothetical protein